MSYVKILIILVLFFALLFTSSAFNQTDIFVLHLGYNGTDIWSSGFEITKGFPYSDTSPPDDSFRADIVSINGSTLYSTNFSISLLVFTHPLTILNSTEYILRMPFYKNADKIIIYAKDEPILTIEIYGFLNTEVPGMIKVEFQDGLPDEKLPYKKESKWRLESYALIGFLFLIITIVLLYVVFMRKRE
ncbi:hypothetical protein HYU15_01700 [Candidatus Woesearchaeota archaeon]|nr:hypothetical protein [Candidatus Woesearchaeota archaeon]